MWYKAREITGKPYIMWDLVAKTTEEYTELYEDDPLVMNKADIPAFEFGICPLKIVTGSLVERTVGEMETAENEYLVKLKLGENKSLIDSIEKSSFTYDSKTFPMDQVSRLFYSGLDKAPPGGDAKCMTTDGTLYNLPNANISAFVTAFYTQLRILSQPDV